MGKTNHSSNSILHGFTADKLAILITDAVVGGGFKTKGEARKRVEDLIKVFIKMGSSGKELNRQKHLKAMEIEYTSKVFWQRKMRELHPDTIEGMYEELEQHLITLGLKSERIAVPAPEPGE